MNRRVASSLLRTAVRSIKTDPSSVGYINPFLEIQKFVSEPILKKQQALFNPSSEEVSKAVSIFLTSLSPKEKDACTFMGSFYHGENVPDFNMPEVCFIGRSNVGKSSLIRILLGDHPELRVSISSKPGHTKALNAYRLGQHFILMDMPGYGFNMPSHFQESVETFLNTRKSLCRTFLLVDAAVGLTSADRTALGMLQELCVPYVLVLTKIDKAGKHKLLKNVLSVMDDCCKLSGHNCFPQPFLVSSKTGDGVMLLQAFIAYITGCVQMQGL